MHGSSPTLLILAAGMGSRYGGLKQLDPMGPGGETVMDYSVHDALVAGFRRVVFVIRRDFEKEFREQVGRKYEGRVEVGYAFQSVDDLPAPFQAPAGRTKPWGTGHAVWSAREQLPGAFAMINADDFYGREAFVDLAGELRKEKVGELPEFTMVAYRLGNTLSEHGSVSRGICEVDGQGNLVSVRERTKIVPVDGHAEDRADPAQAVKLGLDVPVSMNLWGFTPEFLPLLEERLVAFLEERGGEEGCEFYVPAVVDALVGEGLVRVRVLATGSRWFGVTYPEDKPIVQEALRGLAAEYA